MIGSVTMNKNKQTS